MKLQATSIYTVLLCSCSPASQTTQEEQKPQKAVYSDLLRLNWLCGTWQSGSPEGVAVERWEQVNDSTFSGNSFFIAGKDTVSSETLKLVQEGRQLKYIPTVKAQNNGQAVVFTMTSADDSQTVFENPGHDFPQKITYRKISNDSMVAEISGLANGQPQAQAFPMKRIK